MFSRTGKVRVERTEKRDKGMERERGRRRRCKSISDLSSSPFSLSSSSDWKILAPLSPPPTWRLDNPANTLGGVGATYKYEDKSVTIHYMCDSKEIYSPRISAMQDDTNKLSIYITHASACPIPVDLNCAPSIDSHQFDFSSLIKIGGVYIKGSTNNQVYYANPCAQAGHASECMDANVCLKLNWR